VTERLTLATATGLPFLALTFHFATGLIALGAGFVAVVRRKGGTWHRRAGIVFVVAMVATGITAAGISAYEGKGIGGGLMILYFVLTAWTAVRPLPAANRAADIAFMVMALTFAALTYRSGFTALDLPGKQLNGAPAGMLFFLATVILLGGIGDARMILAGRLQGTRRLARHLWRMCFALFIASGSFFLGQMKFIPAPVRNVPVLLVLAVSPLLLLIYWLWAVRRSSFGQSQKNNSLPSMSLTTRVG